MYMPELNGYAFVYGRDGDRFNSGMKDGDGRAFPPPVLDYVDIVVTHGTPVLNLPSFVLDFNHEGEHCGCEKLCFAHFHEARSAGLLIRTSEGPDLTPLGEMETGLKICRTGNCEGDGQGRKESLLVNAAMRGGASGAWIVDMDW
ncbi:hypothetical protein P154DRAFT_540404 [Amniculicola lignicola CBS 123094]|uniref:Uncharacterized protein n=1 Tax=Amniculicola lignicola CBS 123094 TaxID=1392246 RepID=A0A6A5VZZ4_9PLEO|nr:hypothetical protein P154DRAFT_540404 [Amniculicola lignicola CBS 123094]